VATKPDDFPSLAVDHKLCRKARHRDAAPQPKNLDLPAGRKVAAGRANEGLMPWVVAVAVDSVLPWDHIAAHNVLASQ